MMSELEMKEENITLCWKCSKPYEINLEKCPLCLAANANVDFDKAKDEMVLVKLKGEDDVQIITRRRVRYECHICGEPAHFKHTFLLEGARRNPASSAYGKDDCSWCEDDSLFVCKDHEKERTPPDGYSWCSTFTASDRFAHLFLYWKETSL
jgi:hypothetical protein